MNENQKTFVINDGNDKVHTHWKGGNEKPLIEVNLGHVIMNGCPHCEEAGVAEHAVAALYALRRNYRIVITTSRPKEERESIIGWLKSQNIPYDELRMGMPDVVFRIDDRGIPHREWPETLRLIAIREDGSHFGTCPDCGSLLVGTYTDAKKNQIRYCRECEWEADSRVKPVEEKPRAPSGGVPPKTEGKGTGESNKGANASESNRARQSTPVGGKGKDTCNIID